MASHETAVLHAIMLRCSEGLNRIFRNPIGGAWMSHGKALSCGGGDRLLKNATFQQFGVGGEGGSDLIGWKSTVITPEMVGQRVAIFVACEVKKPGGRPSPEQLNFISQVTAAGGIGIVADSVSQITW